MLKFIHAVPVGGSPHSYVVSLRCSGLSGRRSKPSPSIMATKRIPRPKNTSTFAKSKYIDRKVGLLCPSLHTPRRTVNSERRPPRTPGRRRGARPCFYGRREPHHV